MVSYLLSHFIIIEKRYFKERVKSFQFKTGLTRIKKKQKRGRYGFFSYSSNCLIFAQCSIKRPSVIFGGLKIQFSEKLQVYVF